MGQLKNKQHYVWRNYLRSWAEGELIWTHLKKQGVTKQIGLRDVAHGKSFYALIDLTDKEINFLKQYIEQTSHESVKELNLDFLNLFTLPFKVKAELAQANIPGEAKVLLEKKIRELEVNTMEDAYCKTEALGFKLMAAVQSGDFTFLEDQENMFETMMFICFQYFRTKTMRKAVESSFADYKAIDFSRLWKIICYFMSTHICRMLAFHPHLHFTFQKSDGSLSFLTCDQPVFNLLSDRKDSEGTPTKLELYYPLSPKLALTISIVPKPGNWIETTTINNDQIDYYNKKVMNYAEEFCFGETEAILQHYL